MAYTDLAKRDAYQRAYYLAHRAEKIAASKAWKAANPERAHEIAREVMKRRRETQPEAVRANHRRWQEAHPEGVRDHARKSRLAFHYGMTVPEYEAMLASQGGVCAICKKPETHRGRNGEVSRLAVDHNHATGSVRDLLCHSCNTGLGSFLDDPALLVAAADYVRRWHR